MSFGVVYIKHIYNHQCDWTNYLWLMLRSRRPTKMEPMIIYVNAQNINKLTLASILQRPEYSSIVIVIELNRIALKWCDHERMNCNSYRNVAKIQMLI